MRIGSNCEGKNQVYKEENTVKKKKNNNGKKWLKK